MPTNFEPSSPIEAYKAIIDQLVDETSKSVSERLVREAGIYSKQSGQIAANELVGSLDANQREVLAVMLRLERTCAIHDVLALLTWWFFCHEVRLSFRGEPMPFGLSDGLHGDYVGRLNGWSWPGAEGSAAK